MKRPDEAPLDPLLSSVIISCQTVIEWYKFLIRLKRNIFVFDKYSPCRGCPSRGRRDRRDRRGPRGPRGRASSCFHDPWSALS